MDKLIALLDQSISSKINCELLICIHAYLLGSSHVPRVFVPNAVCKTEALHMLETLLLTHPLQVAQKTYSRARPYVGKYVYDINAKNTIIQDIESVIESNLGVGRIVYEESRFTPYGKSLYDDAPELVNVISPKISHAVLAKRERAKKSAPSQIKSGIPCNPVDKALRSSYEQIWTASWMSPSVYLVPGTIEKTVQTIWTHRYESNS